MMELPFANMQTLHWNPGATMPLVLPVQLICNTSDEQLIENVTRNSRLEKTWQKAIPAHSGVAVMCGSGPSLHDTLHDVAGRAGAGGTVFALNGSASYLADHGLLPDFQVIVDPRPETADLIGPAKAHLFASQASPECFKHVPDAILWHQEIGGIEEHFPPYEGGYCLIGGAASVGNSALCLAYAMGFREMHLYGYDSSHRGTEGHAFAQPLNNGDPLAEVHFRGKEYLISFTMKLQAERFMTITAPALKDAGCKIEVHGSGLLPDMFNAPKGQMSEVEKYRAMWKINGYRQFSPGERSAVDFVRIAKPEKNDMVVDFGCGTGRGAFAIRGLSHCQVTLVDFADNCLNDSALWLPFVCADLTEDALPPGDIGYCADVMEHIPPTRVDDTICNIMTAVPKCFFRIHFGEDVSGAFIGEVLHLSVHPSEWWEAAFERLGFEVEWSEPHDDHGMFYVRRQ